ncbi:hypothetical protein AUCHE_22_00060 [Austwickia chelonae NBRC 105200]|uniref:Uncharacterized protein n=1 Tax=Austwickia chelonae NBRC 105200 TaxID=1184607 RepID=K6UNT5_9MICO|nr:hypothetical protein AUCHE_22_00060 [Austwickia chelonae NBRC 105200]
MEPLKLYEIVVSVDVVVLSSGLGVIVDRVEENDGTWVYAVDFARSVHAARQSQLIPLGMLSMK